MAKIYVVLRTALENIGGRARHAPDIPSASGTRAKSGAKNHFRSERIPEFLAIFPFSGKAPKNPPFQSGDRKNAPSVAGAHQAVVPRRVVVFFLKSAPFERFKRKLLRKRKLPESDFGSFGAFETSETPSSF